jgi:putative endonuclease
MFYVHILKSLKNGELYMGFTDNLRKRLVEPHGLPAVAPPVSEFRVGRHPAPKALWFDHSSTGFRPWLSGAWVKHNVGRVFATKSKRPLRLIYAEACLNEKDAKQRAKYLKTGIGKRFLKYRLRHYFKGQHG